MADRSDDVLPPTGARQRLIGEKTSDVPASSPDLGLGTVVDGRYTITGPGIAGGMGVVYPATHLRLGKPRALKVLHPHLVASAETVVRFEEEARLASGLEDPRIVQVHDFGDWAGQSYLVMEWVAGGSLRAELARRADATGRKPRLPLAVALALIRRVTDALAYAHGRGVIHLDVKPENILLERESEQDDLLREGGRPKLADFGISKLLGKEELSRSAAAAGTAGYLAPERLEGAAADPRMDIYSAGAVLYELVCGRIPGGRFKLPHELDAALPAALDSIVDQCLAYAPEERYPTAAELGAALRELQDAHGLDGTSRPPVPDTSAAPSPRAVASPAAPAPAASMSPAPAVITPRRTARGEGPDPSEMILIPAGEFWMGSDEYDTEKPRHHVFLDAFEIDKHPVTNARWKRFTDARGYGERRWWSEEGWRWREQQKVTQPGYWSDKEFNDPEHPVVGVSWYEAEAFCAWAGKRLPAEAEWEKAARGTDGRRYPWGNEWDKARANSGESGIGRPTPVGKYPSGASPYGVHDMAGNVWEWVADWYGGDYYKQSPDRNPRGPDTGTSRVRRGGSWGTSPISLRAADRSRGTPGLRLSNGGVRCARGLP